MSGNSELEFKYIDVMRSDTVVIDTAAKVLCWEAERGYEGCSIVLKWVLINEDSALSLA
jgi:hypothetical protein